AHCLDELDRALEERHVGTAAEVPDEIETHAADAAVVHLLELALAVGLVDDRSPAIVALRARDAVECHAHVGAVAARVDDDRALDAKGLMEFLQVLERRIRRPIGRVGRVGKFRRRTEDVAMRVAGERRRLELRFAGIRIGWSSRLQSMKTWSVPD